MSKSRYVVRPKADWDLDEQAYYYATVGSSDVGHRFLVAAHNTFALLAAQPNIGWHSRLTHPGLKTLRVFRVKGFEKILVLYTRGLDDDCGAFGHCQESGGGPVGKEGREMSGLYFAFFRYSLRCLAIASALL